MDVFCKALVQNKTLISLNVANNGLSADVGKKFEAMLKENSTLIDFEFGFACEQIVAKWVDVEFVEAVSR